MPVREVRVPLGSRLLQRGVIVSIRPIRLLFVMTVFGGTVISGPLAAQIRPDASDISPPPRNYSPYVERTARNGMFAEGLYWGDTHLHTSYSTDAGMLGNTLGPDEAYRFARGEEVITSTGQRARLIRPLDFLVISDHVGTLQLRGKWSLT